MVFIIQRLIITKVEVSAAVGNLSIYLGGGTVAWF